MCVCMYGTEQWRTARQATARSLLSFLFLPCLSFPFFVALCSFCSICSAPVPAACSAAPASTPSAPSAPPPSTAICASPFTLTSSPSSPSSPIRQFANSPDVCCYVASLSSSFAAVSCNLCATLHLPYHQYAHSTPTYAYTPVLSQHFIQQLETFPYCHSLHHHLSLAFLDSALVTVLSVGRRSLRSSVRAALFSHTLCPSFTLCHSHYRSPLLAGFVTHCLF